MRVEKAYSGGVPVTKYPVAHHVKPNEVCLFEKKFSMSGFKYNAIAQREDGALIMFDHDRCGVVPKPKGKYKASVPWNFQSPTNNVLCNNTQPASAEIIEKKGGKNAGIRN